MKPIEETPRLDIAQLRKRDEWEELVANGGGDVLLELPDSQQVVVNIGLITEDAGWRIRMWLRCGGNEGCEGGGCGERRCHLYLKEGGFTGSLELRCRQCHGLLYADQIYPDVAFRKSARAVLRAARIDQRKRKGEK